MDTRSIASSLDQESHRAQNQMLELPMELANLVKLRLAPQRPSIYVVDTRGYIASSPFSQFAAS